MSRVGSARASQGRCMGHIRRQHTADMTTPASVGRWGACTTRSRSQDASSYWLLWRLYNARHKRTYSAVGMLTVHLHCARLLPMPVAHVLTCRLLPVAHIPTCRLLPVAHVPTCRLLLVPHVLMCRLLPVPHVLMCRLLPVAHVLTCRCQ